VYADRACAAGAADETQPYGTGPYGYPQSARHDCRDGGGVRG
jgi:hypothetical protein